MTLVSTRQGQHLIKELKNRYEKEWERDGISILFMDAKQGYIESALVQAVDVPPNYGLYIEEDLLENILEYLERDAPSEAENLEYYVKEFYPDFAKRYYGQGSTA